MRLTRPGAAAAVVGSEENTSPNTATAARMLASMLRSRDPRGLPLLNVPWDGMPRRLSVRAEDSDEPSGDQEGWGSRALRQVETLGLRYRPSQSLPARQAGQDRLSLLPLTECVPVCVRPSMRSTYGRLIYPV